MTIEAGIGFEAARNWWGRSFCVWELLEVEGAIGCVAYQRDLSLAAVLDAEHERLLQSACRVGQGEESLVRSLRCLSVDGCEVDFQRVGGAESDCLRERRCSGEPGGVSLQSQSLYVYKLTCSSRLRRHQRLCWQSQRWHPQSSRPQLMQLTRPRAAAKTRDRERAS